MSSWSDGSQPVSLLRGGAATIARPAALELDLLLSPSERRRRQALAEETASQARSDVHREGFAAGLREGRERAAAEALVAEEAARSQLAAALHTLEQAADALADRRAEWLADVEELIVASALALAEAVLGHAVMAEADPTGEALRRAFALADGLDPIVVKLAPQDLEALPSDALEHLASGRCVRAVADPDLEPGDCVLVSGPTLIDARVSAALDRARVVLS